MAFAITQNCCADATCVSVCPVNCIHPAPGEPDFGTTDMLYVDPRSCINCGACADACPVDAIFPVEALSGPETAYVEINAAWFDAVDPQPVDGPNLHQWSAPTFDRVLPSDFPRLKVAVVGTGPAGMYAVEDLVLHTDAEVTVIDRLQLPDGLVRYGVAPDHPATKQVAHTFSRLHKHPRVTTKLGVTIGEDVSHDQLAASYDAVIYAVGAHADRRLDIPGEDLAGSFPATRFVAWYNGHPDVPADAIRLDAERVVVAGNGNVALDVARILVSDPDTLADTTIAPHALAALRASKVREVVLLGRRGPEHAAYTRPELLALRHFSHADLVVDDHDPLIGAVIDEARPRDHSAVLQGVPRTHIDWSAAPSERRRIVLRFRSAPLAIEGTYATTGVLVTGAGGDQLIPAQTVLRAIGYRGEPVAGLPFDASTATVPHEGGRVLGMRGTYVAGWIKRGPSGGIGTNRRCAAETVATLLDDVVTGALPVTTPTRRFSRRRAARA